MDAAGLANLSEGELDEALAIQEELAGNGEGLANFIARISPMRPPPRHVMPIIEAFEWARRKRTKLAISTPPRHAKTLTALHALSWWLSLTPADTCAYFTYSDTRARAKSRLCRALSLRAGIELASDAANMTEWRTNFGGGLIAGGVGSGLTGVGISGPLVIDDALKNREEADSPIIREKIWEWFNEVAMTRLEGGSPVVIQTRWHEDDLIGRLSKDPDWTIINLPALAEENDPLGREHGEALWPDRFPVEELLSIKRQIGEFSWASLYQGKPRPRGAKVFGPATYYNPQALDLTGCRMLITADPAASEKTTADYSVALAVAVTGKGADMRMYLRDLYRKQVTVPQFARDLRAFQIKNANAPVGVEATGGFKAVPQILREVEPTMRVEEIHPVGDKFQRAQPVAAAWNEIPGRVLVPEDATWVGPYLDELAMFTGINDAHDDQVDVTAHAWNKAQRDGTRAVGARVIGGRKPPVDD